MMFIVPAARVAGVAGPVPRSRTTGGFSVPPEAAATPRATPMEGPAVLDALIGLQSESEPAGSEPAADREARRHGRDLLAQLAALHRALLGQAGDGTVLETLRGLVAAPPEAALDPRLADAVGAIRLRAMVELARYSTVW